MVAESEENVSSSFEFNLESSTLFLNGSEHNVVIRVVDFEINLTWSIISIHAVEIHESSGFLGQMVDVVIQQLKIGLK